MHGLNIKVGDKLIKIQTYFPQRAFDGHGFYFIILKNKFLYNLFFGQYFEQIS